MSARLAELGGTVGVHALFAQFDVNGDGRMHHAELSSMLSAIFGAALDTGEGASKVASLLDALDADADGCVDLAEFEASWRTWFRGAAEPVRALLVVDVQNDFIDGTLRVPDAAAIVIVPYPAYLCTQPRSLSKHPPAFATARPTAHRSDATKS